MSMTPTIREPDSYNAMQPSCQKKIGNVWYISANYGYVTFVRYYDADMLKLDVSFHFKNAVVNLWLGLGTETTWLS